MLVGSSGMLVGKLTMFESRSRVLLCLFVFAKLVVVGRLMMMMRGGVVVSGGAEVMLTRRMFRCLRHLWYSLRLDDRSRIGET
jgi:hypothetical protein